MGRKTWVMPMTLVQKFEANETVAAQQCWYVACERKGAFWWQGWRLEDHDPGTCGDPSKQVLRDTDNDGKLDTMFEIGKNGTKECALFTDESYLTPLKPEDIIPSSGQTIYWTNHLVVTYHHKGKIYQGDMDHPNRS